MTFTETIIRELSALPQGKNCCRKALLFGLFYDGTADAQTRRVTARFRTEEAAELAYGLLESRFSVQGELTEERRAGRRYLCLSATCPALFDMLCTVDSDDARMLFELLGFRCGGCRAAFLRGVFIANASVNDPHKGYHMEISLSATHRADRLAALLETAIELPKRIRRGNKEGLYYKTNGAISDLIYYVGGTKSSFDVANTWVERDIRNNENRATNCVARNISRSVGASQKQIAAIEQLAACGRLSSLPEELQQTAALRVENDAASLSELARLHEPPITKSGLNQRLSKLLRAAEELESE